MPHTPLLPRRRMLALGLAGLAAAPLIGAPRLAAAKEPVFTRSGLAIRGYDPVAYFKESKPVKGSSAYSSTWNGATWRFSSAQNKADFDANPARYAPQYGGYCAYAVSRGYTASTDPAAWRVHNGKLYLNYSLSVRKEWARDIPGNITKADRNWPSVLK